jgi:hypothetical protein
LSLGTFTLPIVSFSILYSIIRGVFLLSQSYGF